MASEDRGDARRNYVLLSAFLFLFFFAQAGAMSFLAIWLKGPIGLDGAGAGTVFSANFIAAMLCQPIYGYISDRVGLQRHVPLFLAGMVVLCGFFFTFGYAPLLQANVVVGAAVGGLYLGLTFVAGSFALESYVDRVGRRYGFEYSRAVSGVRWASPAPHCSPVVSTTSIHASTSSSHRPRASCSCPSS